MKLTEKENLLLRRALDPASSPNEAEMAMAAFARSLRKRGVSGYDFVPSSRQAQPQGPQARPSDAPPPQPPPPEPPKSSPPRHNRRPSKRLMNRLLSQSRPSGHRRRLSLNRALAGGSPPGCTESHSLRSLCWLARRAMTSLLASSIICMTGREPR
jgi:hypothetical protein